VNKEINKIIANLENCIGIFDYFLTPTESNLLVSYIKELQQNNKESERQRKKQKEVINKAINWTIKYQTEWCQEDEVIRDLKQLLDILKGE
jgi:hypothetical protein